MCRDKVRKTKAHVQLNLVTDMNNNHKGYYRYFSHKRQTRQNIGLLLKETGKEVKKNVVKAKIFIISSLSFSLLKFAFRSLSPLKPKKKSGKRKTFNPWTRMRSGNI